MTDVEFDALAKKYNYTEFTEGVPNKKAKHAFPMYSLQKVFDDDKRPFERGIETPKLDGAAISLKYKDGYLVQGCTRGDGIEGEDITDKVYLISSIPNYIKSKEIRQITGEIVGSKKLENARNFASGALNQKSKEIFLEKVNKLVFVAYEIRPFIYEDYILDMDYLEQLGFIIVLDWYCKEFFKTDGTVFRINNNAEYAHLGYTSKHPRGAFALKKRKDVETKETILREVIWDTGKSGRVTPVGIFDEVIIDDAKITRATLNNPGFINDMELEIGDTILVTRSGGVIPKILGKI